VTLGPGATEPPPRDARGLLLGLVTLGLLVTVQLQWSWRRWPDLLVDFGRELYVPWQLASGRVLYADLTYLNGPLSPYVNAALFKLFGVSYRTLIAGNLVVLLAVAALLWSLFSNAGSRLASWTASALFLSVFAFGHYVGVGNYNFMSPYFHEATHGTLLALVAIALMARHLRSESHRSVVLAAITVGLVALTKVELALAIGAAVVAFIALIPARQRRGAAAIFAVGASLPYAAATLVFACYMPLSQAARAVLGSAGYILGTDIEKNRFYELVTGLNAPARHVTAMLVATAIFGIALAAALFLARLAGRDSTSPLLRRLAWAGLALMALCALTIEPDQSARVLPAAVSVALAWLWLLSRRAEPAERARLGALVLIAAFALVALLKLGLAPRIAHYGFFLAMPAFVLVATLLVSLVPLRLGGTPRGAAAFRITAIAFVALLSAHFMNESRLVYLRKTVPIGAPADAIVAYHPQFDPRTLPTMFAVEWLNRNLKPDDTFVAMPEGLILNFLTRRPNPTRYLTFTYPEILAFGEDAMLDDLRRTAPDYILLVHRDSSEYGVDMWGRDPRYGMRIMKWVDANYLPIGRFRDEPFVEPRSFGIKVMKRK